MAEIKWYVLGAVSRGQELKIRDELRRESLDCFVPLSYQIMVIMVKHDHIKQNWDKLKGKVILDCHNICPLEEVYPI